MTLVRKPAAVVALVAATLLGIGVVTDGYTWSESTPTGVRAGGGTDGYTWAD
jgi:hypothetical protein